MKCKNCKREKLFHSEGRFIDGKWAQDNLIPKKLWNKWICSYNCYIRLIDPSLINKKELKK